MLKKGVVVVKASAKLIFGTPGIPASTKPYNTINGVKRVRELGLDAMELEFTRSVHVNETLAPQVKELANKLGVAITCHGQYWVNLAAIDKAKYHASIDRMLSAARRVFECGGWSITWHMGFYMGRPPVKVHEMVKKGVKEVVSKLKDDGVDIWIRPETTGKPTQWGDLAETIKLSQEVEQVLPCIDFSHLFARYNGKKNNSLDDFRKILADIEKGLGRTGLNNMHIQVSGIEYGEKGEKRHLDFKDSDFNYKDMLKVWKEFKIKGVAVTESPNIEVDALLLQKTYKHV